MAAESGGDTRAGIGSRLRAARERKGLTILQAAEKVHTDPRVLEAIEAEDFASLGAAIYARGHIRHYAELVGESAAELQELYAHSTRAAPERPDLTRIARSPREPESSKLAGPAMTAIVVIALFGTVWYFMNSASEKPLPKQVDSQVMSSASSSVAESAQSSEASASPALAAAPPPSPVSPPAPVAKAAIPEPNTKPAATAGAVPAVATTGTSASSSSAALSSTQPTPRKQGELTLKFSSDSWAEVYDASGQRLFYDVGAASSAHTVRGPAPLRVVLGNASGVALEYNGRPAPISSGVLPDGSARFVINAHGRTVPATDGD